MGSNFVHYFLYIIKYYVELFGTYFRPICVRIPVQATHMRESNISYIFFSLLFTILITNIKYAPEKFRLNLRKFESGFLTGMH